MGIRVVLLILCDDWVRFEPGGLTRHDTCGDDPVEMILSSDFCIAVSITFCVCYALIDIHVPPCKFDPSVQVPWV